MNEYYHHHYILFVEVLVLFFVSYLTDHETRARGKKFCTPRSPHRIGSHRVVSGLAASHRVGGIASGRRTASGRIGVGRIFNRLGVGFFWPRARMRVS